MSTPTSTPLKAVKAVKVSKALKILVIHQVPYQKISYHQAIDHDAHHVTYIGRAKAMRDLPDALRCERVVLGDDEDLVAGITARTGPADGFDKVLALSEFGILEATRVREHLGLPGPSAERVSLVRDKVLMKEALRGSGIRLPRFVDAPPACGPLPWQGRTVVKPRQGASSENVMIFADAREALGAYRKLSEPHEYQLEEYVEGDLHHADGLVTDGVLTDLTVSRYVNKPAEYVDGTPLGSHQIHRTDRHWQFTDRVVEALGITEGCIHLEFFSTDGGTDGRTDSGADSGEPVFLEIANRVGGGGVVTMHHRHTGVHLPSHEIALRLGLPRPRPDAATGLHHGWLALPGHHLEPGTVRVEIPDDLRGDPCVDRIHLLAPDRPLPDHITYQEWEVPVFIEASHTDPEELGAFLRTCARRISLHHTPRQAVARTEAAL